MPGLNQAQIIGRVGRDAEIRNLPNGGKVANFSVATDEGYRDKKTGQWVDGVEWHRCTTFQPGLIEVLRKHCLTGRPVFVQGKLQTRKWQDRDGNDRYSTEILIVPGGLVNFLDKSPNATAASATPAEPAAPSSTPATADAGDEFESAIPF